MRVGWNPIKRMKRTGAPCRVTVATVTHIPFEAGFYAQSLDVLRLMLASLRANTGEDFDLLVFDNASCAEAQAYLLEQQRQGAIQYLALSQENVGILGGHNFVFAAAPGEYLAYADSDMFFHPDWLAQSLRVLEILPKVGLVSGVPIHHASEEFAHSALEWARAEPEATLEEGKLIPAEWTADQCQGIGRDTDRYMAEWCEVKNYRISYRGVRAYTGAFINQFVGRKAVIQSTLPYPEDWLLHGAGGLMSKLDEAGYLVLATDGLYVHHLGNTLDAHWRAVAAELGVPPASAPLPPEHDAWSRLARRSLPRRALLRLYDGLFRMLYRGGLP
jgi:hypothetical protein